MRIWDILRVVFFVAAPEGARARGQHGATGVLGHLDVKQLPKTPGLQLIWRKHAESYLIPGGSEVASKGERFFLYDVGYGERFNFRKSIIRRVFATIDSLNKHSSYEWTLVLPPFRSMYDSTEEFVSWGDFFQIQEIRKVHKHTIVFDEFVSKHASSVDTIVFTEKKASEAACKESVTKRRKSYSNEANEGEIDLFGVNFKVRKGYQCKSFEYDQLFDSARSAALVKYIDELCDAGSTSILMDGYESVLPAYEWDRTHPYFALRQHMVYTQVLHDEVSGPLARG
jgi:hypothetical protein